MSDPGSQIPDVQLTATEHVTNALRALVKLIPGAGESIDQLVFGRLDELRQKRVDITLQEILRQLGSRDGEPSRTEEFANLFEKAVPKIARATAEDVRKRFRDLLTNAASLPPSDERWGQANLSEQLLSELDGPALAILACIARYGRTRIVDIVALPQPQVVEQDSFNWDDPILGTLPIGYIWPVVEEWLRRLREKRLINYSTHDTRGGFGGVQLTNLGRMLVEWTVLLPDL